MPVYLDIFHYMLTTALCNAQNTIIWNRILILVFIGPRYAWGPIYGSECLQMSDSKTLLKQVMQVMQVLQVTQVMQANNANRAFQGNVAM